MEQKKLSSRQLKFIDNIFEGMFPKEAYLAAGYKPQSDYAATVRAHRLLQDDRIIAEMERRKEDYDKATRAALARAAEEAANVLKEIGKGKMSKTQRAAVADILKRSTALK